MHYHNKTYNAINIGYDCPHLIGTTMATILTVAALAGTAGATIYSAQQSASTEKKLQGEALAAQEAAQNKAYAYQEKQVADAEAKVAGAEKLAAENAATTLKRKRRAMTTTILTSPLGIGSEANIGLSKLLGG